MLNGGEYVELGTCEITLLADDSMYENGDVRCGSYVIEAGVLVWLAYDNAGTVVGVGERSFGKSLDSIVSGILID